MFDYVLVIIVVSFCFLFWYVDGRADTDNYDKGYSDGISHYRLSLQLRAMREHSNKTLHQVSNDTGLPFIFIRSIEEGDFNALKGEDITDRCNLLFDYYGVDYDSGKLYVKFKDKVISIKSSGDEQPTKKCCKAKGSCLGRCSPLLTIQEPGT